MKTCNYISVNGPHSHENPFFFLLIRLSGVKIVVVENEKCVRSVYITSFSLNEKQDSDIGNRWSECDESLFSD